MSKSAGHWYGLHLGIACSLALVPLTLRAQQALVIEGGTLIDGNGGMPLRNAVVVIEGDRIIQVGREGEVSYPGGAQVLEADGKFVLPGLWDAQVSYNWYYGEVMLNYGITSTLDVGNSGEVAVPHREAVFAGKVRGPRPFTGVSRIGAEPEGGTGLETILTPTRAPASAEETRELVRTFIAAGTDAVMFNDGDLPLEYYIAGIEEADRAGVPVFTRAYGPVYGPWEAVERSTRNLPHSAGIWAAVSRNPRAGGRGAWLDMYADMDEARARQLIERLIENGTALTPTFQANFPGYPRDWARFEAEDRSFFAEADPALMAYYPEERMRAALAFYAGRGPGQERDPAVRERRLRGYQNALRFHEMFVDAGGHLVPGGNTNPSRVPGENLHHEIAVFVEAGVTPMQIIQGATKWAAEMIARDDQLGTVEAGKLADVIILNQDPLRDIANLRDIDTVIFNGAVAELGYNAWYEEPFHRVSDLSPPVEDLMWVAAFREVAFHGRGFRFNGSEPGGPGTPLPNPIESPQPAIETISPVMVTQGDPSVTATVTGFNFVRKSRVYFNGRSVPYRAVSPAELEVTIDSSLLHEAGRMELVVVNPAPLDPEVGAPWGDGTSNKAHLIVEHRY